MTYPPLEGFLYGLYLPDRFGSFYEYASFINIIFFVSAMLIFYQALKFVGISKYISFLCSFGLLSFYSINSYTYHLHLKLKNKNNYMKINNTDLFSILDTKFYKYYFNVKDISKLSQTNLNYLVVIPFFNYQNLQVIIHKNELTFNKI